MITIYKVEQNHIDEVMNFDDLETSSDGMERFLSEIGRDDLAGEYYFERGYRHCVLDVGNMKYIAEEVVQ